MASASYPYEEEEGIVNLYTGFEEYEASREAKARNAERHSAADWEAGWDEDERSVEEDFDDDVEEPLPPQPPKKKAKAPQQEDAVICTRITDGPTLPPDFQHLKRVVTVGRIPPRFDRSVSGMYKKLSPFDIGIREKLNDDTTAVLVFKGAKGTGVLSKWKGMVMDEEEFEAELLRLATKYGNKAGVELEALVTPPRPAPPAARRPTPPASRAAAPRAFIRPAGDSDAAGNLCRKYAAKKQWCPKCTTFTALKVHRNKDNKQFFVKCASYCPWYWSMKNADERELLALQA